MTNEKQPFRFPGLLTHRLPSVLLLVRRDARPNSATRGSAAARDRVLAGRCQDTGSRRYCSFTARATEPWLRSAWRLPTRARRWAVGPDRQQRIARAKIRSTPNDLAKRDGGIARAEIRSVPNDFLRPRRDDRSVQMTVQFRTISSERDRGARHDDAACR